MTLFNFDVDDKVREDFKICAELNRRSMSSQLRELMLAEIKRVSNKNPEAFKGVK